MELGGVWVLWVLLYIPQLRMCAVMCHGFGCTDCAQLFLGVRVTNSYKKKYSFVQL